MAVGVLVGGALQFLIQVPSMRRVGFHYQPLLSFRDERVRQVMRLIGPAILGVAALQINVLVNSIFASEGVGWLTWINRSFRLMHLPIRCLWRCDFDGCPAESGEIGRRGGHGGVSPFFLVCAAPDVSADGACVDWVDGTC